MSAQLRIGVVVGSLRKVSVSRRIAQALPALAPASLQFEDMGIGDLPLYNEDLEPDLPPAWKRLREQVRAVDGLLFVFPEYNRSMPGSVKNAIDVASKPTGQNCWAGKPAGVVSLSAGPLGGLAGAHAMRQTLAGVGVAAMPHPEVYLSHAPKLFDDAGVLVPATQEFFRSYLQQYETWVKRFAATPGESR